MTPSVLVTRRLPQAVESRIDQLFRATLNESDEPLDGEALEKAMREQDGLVTTITDKMDAALLATEGRRVRKSRDARALAKKTRHGRSVAAGQWAWAEWEALKRFWAAGVPVPYPVQIDGTELLMELVTHEGSPAPRLASTRKGSGRAKSGRGRCTTSRIPVTPPSSSPRFSTPTS